MNWFNKIFSAAFVTLILVGCNTIFQTAHYQQQIQEKLNLNKQEAFNKIAFLTFSVSLEDSIKDIYEFKLKEAFFADGQLKKNAFNQRMAIEPYYFYFEVSDENKKSPGLIRIPNPLETAYEYVEETGSLNKKVVKKATGEVSLRFQYGSGSKYLSIYKPQLNSLKLKRIYHAML